MEYVALIEIDDFLQFQEQHQKKSFNKKDLEKIHHKIILAKKLKTNYRLELEFLIE